MEISGMRMLYSLEMIRPTIDCICIGIFDSIWNRAIFQLVILKVFFLVSSPVAEMRLLGFLLRIANPAKNRPGSSIKMPKTRKNSIYLLLFQIQVCRIDYSIAEAVVQQKKKTSTFLWRFVFALPIFPGRPTYCPAVRKCPVDTCRQNRPPSNSAGSSHIK